METVNDIALRAPAPDDFPVLREIRNDRAAQEILLGHPEVRGGDDTESWVARRLDDPSGRFLVIDRGGDCIGFVQLTAWHRLDRHAHFGIALHRRVRGSGFGTVAMRRLLDYAAAAGLRKLLCEVRADNAAALALYRRLGFRDVGTLSAHYDDGEQRWNVALMEIVLSSGQAT